MRTEPLRRPRAPRALPVLATLAAGALFAACEPVPIEASPAFAAPAHGQTAVPPGLPLMLGGAAAGLPDDYAMHGAVEVLDEATGEPVAGKLLRKGDDLIFRPAQPWKANASYMWTAWLPDSLSRAPGRPIPTHLSGTAAFMVGDHLELLAAALDLEGRPCFVLSRPARVSDYSGLRLEVDGAEIEEVRVVGIHPERWWPGYHLHPDDPGIDVKCLEASAPVAVGSVLELWWSDSAEPWSLEVEDDVFALVVSLYRGSME